MLSKLGRFQRQKNRTWRVVSRKVASFLTRAQLRRAFHSVESIVGSLQCTRLRRLQAAKVQVSMSDAGRCYDNAMQESFWGTLKTECADRPFPSKGGRTQSVV